MNNQENNQAPVPCLATVIRGETVWFDIESNGSVLIGSGGHCKIQLEGDGVRSLHCIVAMKDGAVELRDWNTGSTLVNGVAINDPVELKNGDRIRICGHEIEAVLESVAASAEGQVANPPVHSQPADSVVPPVEIHGPNQIQVEFAQPGQSPVQKEVAPLPSPAVEVGGVPQAPTQQTVSQFQQPVPQPEQVDAPQLEQVVQQDDQVTQPEPAAADQPTLEEDQQNSQSDPQLDPQPAEFSQQAEAAVPVLEPQADLTPVEATASAVSQPVAPELGEMLMSSPDETPTDETQPEPAVVEVPQADDVQPLNDVQPVQEPAAETLPAEFVCDVNVGLNDEGVEQIQVGADDPTSDSLEALRFENEQLRAELAQKNSEPASNDGDILSRDQTLNMISRMQELVKALKDSGQRNCELEEQLRNAETSPQDNSESSEVESDSSDQLAQLRDQVGSLQSQLTSALEEVNRLREQASAFEASKQKLAEIQLEFTRERDAIARQQVELGNLKVELQNRLEQVRQATVVETPVEAVPEQVATAEPESEIASQIADLIQRVSGDE